MSASIRDMPVRVAHLTSAHPRFDTRIFLKQCRSLVNAGYQVSLVVADGKGDAAVDGVEIRDVGKSNDRIDRMFGATKRVFREAVKLDAAIYHIHDPELIPVGLKLKRLGKRVVFDSHEDVPKQTLGKYYLSVPVRYLLSYAFAVYEWLVCRRFDAIVAATPAICQKFKPMVARVLAVNNYPILGELSGGGGWSIRRNAVCYIGGIAEIRGIKEMVRALEHTTTDVRLLLGGSFENAAIADEVRKYPGWSFVEDHGFVGRSEVSQIMASSIAGLVLFLPLPNHIDAQPNKMFEYMSAGIPLIASNFSLWREIIEGDDCGLCVDPSDFRAIAAAIDQLVLDPGRARQMGENGRRAVQERYNWTVEERKLLGLYRELVGS